MEDNIIEFPSESVGTYEDISPKDMLKGCSEEELEVAIVIANRPDGSLFLASSTGDLYKMLWFLEVAKAEVLEMGQDE
jgi:hypothetical protein